jgi:glutathione reductase (NADPH)
LLVYASHFSEDFENAAGFGWTAGKRSFDWAKLIANKNEEITRLNGVYHRLLRESGVTILDGHARILDPHTVAIGEKQYTARYLLVAVGSWPVVPKLPGSEHAITSNEAFYLPTLPQKIIIVGGGYIGVEFAGIFHGLGVEVSQLYWDSLFLRGFDDDCREALAEEMIKRGIDLRFKTDIEGIERIGNRLRATLTTGASLEADQILYAIGRVPNTRSLGLESVGVKLEENGAVAVDEYSKTNVDNIYAIGDCTDRIMLTPVAIAEGRAIAETLFNKNPQKPVYTNVPSVVFSTPSLGAVGLTETEAKVQFKNIDIYKTGFRPLKHTLTGQNERTTMKIIVDQATDKVVGCHMVGADAGEIIQGIAIAMNCGATKAQFDATIGIHPTAAEEFVTMKTKVAPRAT